MEVLITTANKTSKTDSTPPVGISILICSNISAWRLFSRCVSRLHYPRERNAMAHVIIRDSNILGAEPILRGTRVC